MRLVTVLDLVACDPSRHDGGEPLAIKQSGGGDGDNIYSSNNNDNDDNDNGEEVEEEGEEAENSASLPGAHRRPLWRIARQEDLYQVNEFLKFVGPYWWCLWRVLWLPFQLGATAVCVFLSLFVALSPWASQRDPAVGGVEATIEQVEAYHDDAKHGGKSNSRGGKSRGQGSPPRKHLKARKKSTR